jgi:hypothetical protein
VYLFLLDVSHLGVECGYLRLFCDILLEELDKLPGDGRTQIGFITYNSSVHFYNLAEGLRQPLQMTVVDTEGTLQLLLCLYIVYYLFNLHHPEKRSVKSPVTVGLLAGYNSRRISVKQMQFLTIRLCTYTITVVQCVANKC